MLDIFLGSLTIGLVNGSFYALMSLGLSLVFGLLNTLNMAHGVFFMMGAFAAWAANYYLGIGYLPALLVSAALVGVLGWLIERMLVRRTYGLDPLYGFMLTFGLATAIQGAFQARFGSSGLPLSTPDWLSGIVDLHYIVFPAYRLWVVAIGVCACAALWWLIDKTRIGSVLRASSESGAIAEALGVRVGRVFSVTFAISAVLAGMAGALAAPIYQVSPLMGDNILLVAFAIIVIGGLGSIAGTVISSFALAVLESLTQVVYPQASELIIFGFMCVVLLLRPQGMFGISVVKSHEFSASKNSGRSSTESPDSTLRRVSRFTPVACLAAIAVLPHVVYPIILIKIALFAIFAASFNFLLGFAGIVSFGQAALFGTAAYVTAQAASRWNLSAEISIALGVVLATALGLVMGAIAIRRRGIYQAMITLGIAQIVYFYYLQTDFTHGEDGIHSVPRGNLFGLIDLRSDLTLYYITAMALFAVFWGLHRLLRTDFGMAICAIRDNEKRAVSLGYRVDRFKVIAFGIAAACAGLAGSLDAVVFQLATLAGVHWKLSGEAVLMTLIGGTGTLIGPLIGAAVLVGMQQYLAPLGSWVTLIQGTVFVLCVLFFREGIWSRRRLPKQLSALVLARTKPRRNEHQA
ncbi:MULTISPECIES: ABC transporter permease [unclassified Burkholderia]|uniref:ABC transporter permease n=1 Tax=unclassified Burkholderia TaxID=2613784 RepID=UPI002AAFA0D2|nr:MULTISPECIES: ABC transporter permease [unclassified Burkholderia]